MRIDTAIMRSYLPKSINRWLLAVVALSLLAGWLTAHWTLGAAAAFTALCVLAIRHPHLGRLSPFRWLKQWYSRGAAASAAGGPDEQCEAGLSQSNAGDSLVQQMIRQGRVALLLRPQIAASLPPADIEAAQAALDDVMAMVPEGQVAVRARCYDALDEEATERAERLVHVEGLFLDRHTVTNREY